MSPRRRDAGQPYFRERRHGRKTVAHRGTLRTPPWWLRSGRSRAPKCTRTGRTRPRTFGALVADCWWSGCSRRESSAGTRHLPGWDLGTASAQCGGPGVSRQGGTDSSRQADFTGVTAEKTPKWQLFSEWATFARTTSGHLATSGRERYASVVDRKQEAI